MKRAWLGVALLSGSWLLGLSYYHAASWVCWAAIAAIGAMLFGGVVEQWAGRIESAVALALTLPALWLAPWPYRAAPLLIVVGLAPTVAGVTHRFARRFSLGLCVAGLVLLAQIPALALYEHWTARSHELPAPLTVLLGGVAQLLGIDSSINENNIVLYTMRRSHPLGATWELFLDPPTFCFLIGGMALIAIRVWSSVARDARLAALGASAGRLVLAVLVWLPVRSGFLMALFMHRALRSDFEAPLKLFGQFWNPWLHLLLLAGPVLLAWRFVRLPSAEMATAGVPPANAKAPKPLLRGIYAALAALAAAAAVALFIAGQFWDPPGERKAGRVAVDEFHSEWEKTDRAMDTEWYGQLSGYNYYCIYDYLSRFYKTSRIEQPIDDKMLDSVDVLIVKTPTARYAPAEIEAIERFVKRGGGLMLIGEHTDVFRTGEFLNEISRNFGFTFRYDVLFGIDSPFVELYERPLIAHPITQRMPPLDFEISCSIDPGSSAGQAVMTNTGLWNLPPDYYALNYYPQVEDRADARYGAWIQTWATRHGAGRVVAYTDSTQFSNFSTFEPGKVEVLMGMVEWLNRSGGFTAANLLLTILAIALACGAIFLARPWDGCWLVLVAAGVLGWFVAVLAIRAAHAAELPLPKNERPMVNVVMDRTISDAPLPKGGFIAGQDDAFGIFERNVLRLGYFLSRQSGTDALKGDLLVVLNPDRDVPADWLADVADYVEKGGKLLVLDAPPTKPEQKSTANSLLHRFGLAVDPQTNYSGTAMLTAGGTVMLTAGSTAKPGDGSTISVASAASVSGGQPLAVLPGIPATGNQPIVVAATRQFGKGSVTVVGFSSRFTDSNMGGTGDALPDADLRNLYEFEYRLLRGIVGSAPPR